MNKINSEFNACMHKNTCIKLQSRIEHLETELAAALASQTQQEPVSQEKKYLVGMTVQDGHDTLINWHGRHPNSFPVDTKFFAIPPALEGDK